MWRWPLWLLHVLTPATSCAISSAALMVNSQRLRRSRHFLCSCSPAGCQFISGLWDRMFFFIFWVKWQSLILGTVLLSVFVLCLAPSSAAEPGSCPCCCWLQCSWLVLPCALELCDSEGARLHHPISSFALLQFLMLQKPPELGWYQMAAISGHLIWWHSGCVVFHTYLFSSVMWYPAGATG